MVRKLHSLAGLIAALFLTVLSLSGVALSLDPALERLQATVPADGQISVAALAGRVAQHYPDVEQIERTPSGSIIVYYTRNDQPGADRVDPVSGQGIAPHAPSGFSRWVKDLHRSLLLDTPGRAVVGVVAPAAPPPLLTFGLGVVVGALAVQPHWGWTRTRPRLSI